MLIGMILETLGIGLIIPALALMTKPDFFEHYPALEPLLNALGHPTQKQLIIVGMISLATVYIVKTLYLSLLSYMQLRFVFSVQEDLSNKLFAGYLRQSYSFHLLRNSGQLIQNIINETNQFTQNALNPGMQLLAELVVLVGIVSLLLFIEPLGTLLLLIVLVIFGFIFIRVTKRRGHYWGVARQFHDGKRVQHIQQGLGSIKDVKLLGREDDFILQYAIHSNSSARIGEKQHFIASLPRLWLELLAVTGLVVLVIVMLEKGESVSDLLPVLGLFAAAAFRLLPSVSKILTAGQSLRFSLPVIDMIFTELSLEVAIQEPVVASVLIPFNHKIHLKNVCYKYNGTNNNVLNNIEITILRGTSIGIVGSSGAGKSTLIDLILGLLTPSEGRIEVDGKDIQGNLRAWQDQIGYVPQSIYLTDDSLRSNVAFGISPDKIDESAVQSAIASAHMEEFVKNLPEGLDTIVGERGVRISGGQRQRIGIARALYHNPKILVLDEATSALDSNTESSIVDSIQALHGNKTIIVVAHRLTTVSNLDQLYVLDKGEFVESGVPSVIIRNIQNSKVKKNDYSVE
jgi:ABC-type multidrug transport system fused ATPase/permease subunit